MRAISDEQQMHCHECSTANTVDSKYCKECGARINDGYRSLVLSIQDRPADGDPVAEERLAKLLDMGFWHNEAGNIDAAILACEAALALNPRSTTAHSLLGTLFEKKGEDEKAIQHFEMVLGLNPNSPADAAKLDQLRRGVHVRAAAPPLSHLWLPPILHKMGPRLREKWENGDSAPSMKPRAPKLPLYAAGGAVVLVLAIGLLLVKPHSPSALPVNAVNAAAPMPVAISRSAFGTGNALSAAASTPIAPIVMTSPPSLIETPPHGPSLSANDPFAAPRMMRSYSSPPAPSIYSLPAAARVRVSHRRNTGDLPPLTLTATPASDGGIAPAPVMVGPIATVAPIPQHTVVVRSLTAPPPSASPSWGDSRIHITIQQNRSPDAGPAASTDDGGAPASAGQGDADQQHALALQQQGNFKHAIAAYQAAIHAYNAQIAAGRDVDAAQRGLDVCQTGLQICQQSLS